jgi:hypothetical protein
VSDRGSRPTLLRLRGCPLGSGSIDSDNAWGDIENVAVMAQEVTDLMLIKGADGFLRVDYSMLGFEMLTRK